MDFFIFVVVRSLHGTIRKRYNILVLKACEVLTSIIQRKFHIFKQTKDVQAVIDELATKGV